MRLAAERFPAASQNPFRAIVCGRWSWPAARPKATRFRKSTSPTSAPASSLTRRTAVNYHLASNTNVFRPYYQFKEAERYFIYFDPSILDRLPCAT